MIDKTWHLADVLAVLWFVGFIGKKGQSDWFDSRAVPSSVMNELKFLFSSHTIDVGIKENKHDESQILFIHLLEQKWTWRPR